MSCFSKGMRHGIPIMLGYFSVSFGFGILAVKSGLPVWGAALLSATNLTSAGQTAGVLIYAAGGSLWELALTQLVINSRYALMGLSLSQRLAPSFRIGHRLLAAYGITDEIFAVAYAQPFLLTPAYLYGLIAVSAFGWVAGTVLGAAAGQLLPALVTDAMGILLYGMFLAIFIPPARHRRPVLLCVLMAAALSTLFYYVLPAVPNGFAIVISAVVSAAVCAALYPQRAEAGEETA